MTHTTYVQMYYSDSCHRLVIHTLYNYINFNAIYSLLKAKLTASQVVNPESHS